MSAGLRVVSLQAANVKRLVAVDITPDPDSPTVVISGRNGQGKTSVLDSIWLALGGGPAAKGTAKPIRDGQATAKVTVDLGELKVTRTWTGDKTSLKVESADGSKYSSPQAMLDKLVGRLSFDPLAFAQQDERSQRQTLLRLVELPFDLGELDSIRLGTFEARTDVNRDLKNARARLDGMPTTPADLPDSEQSATDLLGKVRKATEQQQRAAQMRQGLDIARAEVARLEQKLLAAREIVAQQDAAVTQIPSNLPDPAVFEAQLADLEQTNAAVRAAQTRSDAATRVEQLEQASKKYSDELDAIDQRRKDALAAAIMPIDGLGLDETGITYQGVPFKQASAAEQLRVSVAMAMALNPQVRVIRVLDGSLLDSTNLALIAEMATDKGFQVWIERVDETGDVGIVIEDGAVVAAAS